MKNLINDVEVDVIAYHKKGLKKDKKKRMLKSEFLKLKDKNYYFRAFQINYNPTIFLKDEIY
jgi:hypothetical protein